MSENYTPEHIIDFLRSVVNVYKLKIQNLRSLTDLILRSIEVFFLADLAATVINFDWRIASTESIGTDFCVC